MKKVIVTGGAGFIGSAFVRKLNREGINDILIVDDLKDSVKWKNLRNLRFSDYINKNDFLEAVKTDKICYDPQAVVHMGACSSTSETNADFLIENNYRFTRILAEWAVEKNIRFLYAGSAASYGNGKKGFSDETDLNLLSPLNIYGYSKHLFDLYAQQSGLLDRIVGLKYFNVFGPGEYHKGDMASMVFKAFHQVKEKGSVDLFKSYRDEYFDGEQMRDFVYVKDCVDVMWWLLMYSQVNGLFNLGTGRARSWNDLVNAVFKAMGEDPVIKYIDMPMNIRDSYQYFTQAEMGRLKKTGCPLDFQLLEEAIRDYVVNHLQVDQSELNGSGNRKVRLVS